MNPGLSWGLKQGNLLLVQPPTLLCSFFLGIQRRARGGVLSSPCLPRDRRAYTPEAAYLSGVQGPIPQLGRCGGGGVLWRLLMTWEVCLAGRDPKSGACKECLARSGLWEAFRLGDREGPGRVAHLPRPWEGSQG